MASTPAVDPDFVAFINDFLFNPSPQYSSARSVLRHQRTPPRHKRYKSMWRAAATSLMKRRYSSRETHLPFADHPLKELPAQVCIDNRNSSNETHLPIADHLHKECPFEASSDNGYLPSQFSLNSADERPRDLPLEASANDGHASQATNFSSPDKILRNSPSHIFPDDRPSSHAIDSLSTNQRLRYLPSQGSLGFGGGWTTIDFVQPDHSSFDVDSLKEAPLIRPPSSNATMKGSSLGCHSKVQHLEATSSPTVPKRSSRKPPRPPRPSMSRSASYRAIRLKNAARRATVDNAQMRKPKSSKSSSKATTFWALIITLCFAFIMLVQGFLGSSSKGLYFKAEDKRVGEGVSYLGVPPVSSESGAQAFVAEHDAGSTSDQLQQKPRNWLFTNSQGHQLRKRGTMSRLLC